MFVRWRAEGALGICPYVYAHIPGAPSALHLTKILGMLLYNSGYFEVIELLLVQNVTEEWMISQSREYLLVFLDVC